MDYFAGTKKDFEKDTPKYFARTTEEPTKPGLYWALIPGGWLGIHLESTAVCGLYYDVHPIKELIIDIGITEWIGPLPEPE